METTESGGPDKGSATERFFALIRESGVLPGDQSAEEAATAVLCTLARRVSMGETGDLLDTLPGELRRRFGPCMLHAGEPVEAFGEKRFVRLVAEHLGVDEERAQVISLAVFGAFRTQFHSPELGKLEAQLPKDLKTLWHGHEHTPLVGAPGSSLEEGERETPHQRAHRSGDKAPTDREKRSGRPEWEKRDPPNLSGEGGG